LAVAEVAELVASAIISPYDFKNDRKAASGRSSWRLQKTGGSNRPFWNSELTKLGEQTMKVKP
jgi:hypothetical protein